MTATQTTTKFASVIARNGNALYLANDGKYYIEAIRATLRLFDTKEQAVAAGKAHIEADPQLLRAGFYAQSWEVAND